MPDSLATLSIDTTLNHCAAAIVREDRVLAVRVDDTPIGHNERLAPLVEALLAKADLRPTDLGRIVVSTGPGSFTGIRGGIAFARGLALALDIPCVGVSTLTALAARQSGSTLAVVEGRNGMVYAQMFSGADPTSAAALMSMDEIAAQGWSPDVIIGTACVMLNPIFPMGHIQTVSGVDPVALAILGAQLDPATHPALAHYMRDAGATLPA